MPTTNCECGHSTAVHENQDGECCKCECIEFQASTVCSHCGESHDPDISAAIAEEATW